MVVEIFLVFLISLLEVLLFIVKFLIIILFWEEGVIVIGRLGRLWGLDWGIRNFWEFKRWFLGVVCIGGLVLDRSISLLFEVFIEILILFFWFGVGFRLILFAVGGVGGFLGGLGFVYGLGFLRVRLFFKGGLGW